MLVILTTTYAEKVPVVVSSKIIYMAMKAIIKGELDKATETWEIGPLQCGHVQVTPAAPPMCKRGWSSWQRGTLFCKLRPHCT